MVFNDKVDQKAILVICWLQIIYTETVTASRLDYWGLHCHKILQLQEIF